KRKPERDSRPPAAGADVHDRAFEPPHDVNAAQAVLQQHPPRFGGVADRGQPGGLEDRLEPVLKDWGRRRRSDSAPSLRWSSRLPKRPSTRGGRSWAPPPPR